MVEGVPQEEQRWPLAKVDILQSLPLEEIERLALLSASVRLVAGDSFDLDEGRWALLLLTSGQVRVHEPNTTAPASPSPWSRVRPSWRKQASLAWPLRDDGRRGPRTVGLTSP